MQTFCGRTTYGSSYCDKCITEAERKNIENQKSLVATTYKTTHERLSNVEPLTGQCSYRMVRGEHKGWYCNAPCEDLYCEDHKKRVPIMVFGHPKQPNTEGLGCQRMVDSE